MAQATAKTEEFQPEVPDSDRYCLNRVIGQPEQAALPDKVIEKYWELRRIGSRVSYTPSMGDFITLGFALGYGKKTAREERPESLVELWRNKQINFDHPVEAIFGKGNKLRPAVFKGVTGAGLVKVQFNGDTEERDLDPDNVILAKPLASAA